MGDLTIQAWIKPDDFDAIMTIASKWASNLNRRMYRLRITTSGELDFSLSTDGTSGTITTVTTSSMDLTAGIWQHVAVVLDLSEGTADFYKNGSFIEQETGLPNSIADKTPNFMVGTWNIVTLPQEYFDGGIFRVDLFDDKRTAGEILSSYQDPQIDLSAAGNIIGSWVFGEAAAATAIDNEQGDAGRDLKPYNGGDTTFGNCGRTSGPIPT